MKLEGPESKSESPAPASFAKAVPTVHGQVITTDTAGLHTADIRIPVQDGEIPAYHACPSGGDAHPLVLVIHEIFGVHEHIRDVCRRLAKLGYCAIAPDLFARLGDASNMADMNAIMSTMVGRTSDRQLMSDLDAALAWAAKSGNADLSKLAATGFCWGGRVTWMYSAHNPQLKAAVAWYGRLEGQASELQPKHPLDIAAQLKVPVLGLYGGADQSISPDSIERMRSALRMGDSGSEIVVYPDTPHAFFADYRPNYRRSAAEDGWRRLQQWLKTHGVA